jgi:hypothetical protein
MSAMHPLRVQERRVVRAAARGLSARAAAEYAGFHPASGPRLVRRLLVEIEAERARLLGDARRRGLVVDHLGTADAHRLLMEAIDGP